MIRCTPAIGFQFLAVMLLAPGLVQGEPQADAATSHYVFFGRDRDRLPGHAFLENRTFEGAQVTYAWKQLEPTEDQYEFAAIDADIAILKAQHKRLWIQLQDGTFSPDRQAVPRYIMTRPQYGGGTHPQYDDTG